MVTSRRLPGARDQPLPAPAPAKDSAVDRLAAIVDRRRNPRLAGRANPRNDADIAEGFRRRRGGSSNGLAAEFVAREKTWLRDRFRRPRR
jgi:hypothetical protein